MSPFSVLFHLSALRSKFDPSDRLSNRPAPLSPRSKVRSFVRSFERVRTHYQSKGHGGGGSFLSGDEQTLQQTYFRGSARCVQSFDDSLSFAIRMTYRISLRSSSLWEPRHPLLKVLVCFVIEVQT